MPTSCDSIIAQGIVNDCESMSVRGMEADGIIMNRDDIDFSATVFDSANPNIIRTLVLKTGKKAYDVVQIGNTPFSGLVSNLNVGTYRNTWTHDIPIAVLGDDPDVVNGIIDPLSNGTFVLILKNKTKGTNGNGEYKVFGYAQGCRASAGTNDKWSEDTEGGYLVTLQEANSPKAGMFFYNTDSSTTAAAYEALKA